MSSDYRFGPSWGADTQLYNDAQIKRVRDKMLNKGTTMPNPVPSDRQVGGSHYKDMAIEPSEFIHRNNIGWLEGNAIKYICRHSRKHGAMDIDKAIHYLELLKEWQYGQSKS